MLIPLSWLLSVHRLVGFLISKWERIGGSGTTFLTMLNAVWWWTFHAFFVLNWCQKGSETEPNSGLNWKSCRAISKNYLNFVKFCGAGNCFSATSLELPSVIPVVETKCLKNPVSCTLNWHFSELNVTLFSQSFCKSTHKRLSCFSINKKVIHAFGHTRQVFYNCVHACIWKFMHW